VDLLIISKDTAIRELNNLIENNSSNGKKREGQSGTTHIDATQMRRKITER